MTGEETGGGRAAEINREAGEKGEIQREGHEIRSTMAPVFSVTRKRARDFGIPFDNCRPRGPYFKVYAGIPGYCFDVQLPTFGLLKPHRSSHTTLVRC